jgi:hypothetical protein
MEIPQSKNSSSLLTLSKDANVEEKEKMMEFFALK